MDREYANHMLNTDPEFQQLRAKYNALGILRLLIWVAAAILAIISGINGAWVVLLVGLAVSFALVMLVEYNRATTLTHQRRRAIKMGLIIEDDLH